jgi:iron complex transport system permease protein
MPHKKLLVLALILLVMLMTAVYLLSGLNMQYIHFAMSVRIPKWAVMLVTAFCIGSASMVFQTLINNTMVTPCLLGMNALYILIHTLVVFLFGSTSLFIRTKVLSFSLDLIVMGAVAVLLYGLLFKKARGNVLYIVLAGTVMATLFSSLTSALQRVMDPNEYETLQNALIASFHNVNSGIMTFALIAILGIILVLRKDLTLLNVLALGKHQAINLGVPYDRTVRRLLLGVTLFIAIATALVGPISFLGLIIANLSRQLFKTYRHSYLIFGGVFIGMILLLSGQTLIERVFRFSTTIGVFINVGGGVYFLYLLLKNRRYNQ